MSQVECKFLWAHRCMRPAAALLLCGALVAPAAAEPTLEVRGRMRLELDQLERHDRTLVVAGRLVEEAQNDPMAGWTAALRVMATDSQGRETFVFGAAMPADADGKFVFRVSPVGAGRYTVHLSGSGDSVFAAPAPVDREVDLGRRAIELHLLVPAELPARSSTLPVGIEAVALDHVTASNAGDAPAEEGLTVDLELDGMAAATMVLVGGRATTQLALAHATPGREVLVSARFAGDPTRGPAEASQRVRLVEEATLTLVTEQSHAVAGSELVLRGRLAFGGRGVGGLPVTVELVADDRDTPMPPVQTDPSGSYEVRVKLPDATRAAFQAHFGITEAKARSLPPARSDVLVIEVMRDFSLAGLGSRPAGAALAIAGALLAILGLLRLGIRLLPRRRQRAQARALAAPPRATSRQALDHRLAGRVLDAERASTIAGARVCLLGASVSAVTGSQGEFDLGTVAAGTYTLEAVRQGYARLVVSIVVPHRGEHASMELRLVPLRAEILRVYGAALAPYVPRDAKLGLRTPRELAQVARFAPVASVAALQRLVEESCYGPAVPDAETLARVEALSGTLPTPSG